MGNQLKDQDEIKVLKFARNTMMNFLKGKGFKYPDSYVARAAGSNGYRLNFTGTNIIPFPKYKEEIMELFPKVEFAQEPSSTVLILELEKYVKSYIASKKVIPEVEEEHVVTFKKPEPQVKKAEVKVKEKEKPTVIPQVREEKVEQPTVRKVEPVISPRAEIELENKRATLLNEIRNLLQTVMTLSELQKQYILKKYDGSNNDTAEIQINDRRTMNRALFILNSAGYFSAVIGSKVIASKNEDVIKSLPAYNRILATVNECSNFINKVQRWMDNNNVLGEIITHPILIAQSAYADELEIEFVNPTEAQITEQLFLVNGFQVRKNVLMLYIPLTRPMLIKPFIDAEVKRENFNRVLEGAGKSARKSCISTNYEEFHFLEFNRKTDPNHVNGIIKSIREFGVIDDVKVVETTCVDGTLKKWIADGQHTFLAEKALKVPIEYKLIKVDTLFELVRLIAVLNNRRKLWKLLDYLHAWMSMRISIYAKINHWVKIKKLPFTTVLETISGKEKNVAADTFRDGNFRENQSIDYEFILTQVSELKSLLPRSNMILTAMSRIVRDTENFDVIRMKKAIKKSNTKSIFVAEDTLADTIKKIKELYDLE